MKIYYNDVIGECTINEFRNDSVPNTTYEIYCSNSEIPKEIVREELINWYNLDENVSIHINYQ